jgi:hypothetical protein
MHLELVGNLVPYSLRIITLGKKVIDVLWLTVAEGAGGVAGPILLREVISCRSSSKDSKPGEEMTLWFRSCMPNRGGSEFRVSTKKLDLVSRGCSVLS